MTFVPRGAATGVKLCNLDFLEVPRRPIGAIIRAAGETVTSARAEWLLMVDGAARGNPGKAGCGAVICDENGATVKELSRYLGKTTNNVAEYEALLMGLEALIALGKKNIRVQSDSELVVRQLNGQYRVRDTKLQLLFERARDLLRHFDRCTILHVRREANRLADKLANRAIDEACKKNHAG